MYVNVKEMKDTTHSVLPGQLWDVNLWWGRKRGRSKHVGTAHVLDCYIPPAMIIEKWSWLKPKKTYQMAQPTGWKAPSPKLCCKPELWAWMKSHLAREYLDDASTTHRQIPRHSLSLPSTAPCSSPKLFQSCLCILRNRAAGQHK